MSSKEDSRIYIGNLPPDIRSKDLEDLFQKYGKINYVDLKNRKGPPFAFVEYEDARDAEDAIEGRDGYNYDGYKLRVELQKGSRSGGGSGSTGDSDKFKTISRSSRGGAPSRRSQYRCIITGLPTTGSWQDLKDHMREAGNVCYADVYKDGTGVVEFLRYEDMKYAARKLDDSKFRSHEGETAYVRVKMDQQFENSSQSKSRSRSRSSRRGERASPSYSPIKKSRSSDRSRSASKSHSRSRSRSPRSRSRSRSYRRHTSKSRSRSISRFKTRKSKSKSRSRSRSRSYER